MMIHKVGQIVGDVGKFKVRFSLNLKTVHLAKRLKLNETRNPAPCRAIQGPSPCGPRQVDCAAFALRLSDSPMDDAA